MFTICYHILHNVMLTSDNSFIVVKDSERGGGVVSVRFPGHIYKWLERLVEEGEYHNMSQAVIGEMTKAKARIDIERSASKEAIIQYIRQNPGIIFEAIERD